jgi:hypothetical protein
MSQVKDIYDGIKHRLPDRVNLFPALNRAVRTISKRLFYHDVSMVRGSLAVTIAAGGNSGTLPSDCWGLVGRPYISGKTSFLAPVPDPRYKLLYTSDAEPLYYEVAGLTINLYPGSSAEATLNGSYWARPAALTALTDTMPFNELFDDAIQEVLIHTYKTGLSSGDGNDIGLLTNFINKAVDEVAPYLDKQAMTQVEDVLGLDYLTHEEF